MGYRGALGKQPTLRDGASALAAVLSPIVALVAVIFGGAGIYDYFEYRGERAYTRADCTMLAKPPRESSGSKRPASVTRHYPVVVPAAKAVETEATINVDRSAFSGRRDYEGVGGDGALPVRSSLPAPVTCFYDPDAPRKVVLNRAQSFSVLPLALWGLALLLACLGMRRYFR